MTPELDRIEDVVQLGCGGDVIWIDTDRNIALVTDVKPLGDWPLEQPKRSPIRQLTLSVAIEVWPQQRRTVARTVPQPAPAVRLRQNPIEEALLDRFELLTMKLHQAISASRFCSNHFD